MQLKFSDQSDGRGEFFGDKQEALRRIHYCLDKLETAEEFLPGIYYHTELVPKLTLEELIGALVAAEEYLE